MTIFFAALRRRYISGAAAICAAAVCLGPQAHTATAPIPNFAPDSFTSWHLDRPDGEGDNFMPPESGPGPVTFDPAHPYRPNGEADSAGGNPTYRVADLSNPILKPWAVEQMKKWNDVVLAGKVPFVARERCYPTGVPAWDIFRRVRSTPVYFIQSPKEVVMIWRSDSQMRHVYLNVPHSAHPKPSWYGESVGHYEGGDTLVIDTIALLNDPLSFVDNYRTPHTDQLHVVERFHMTDGGKFMDVDIHVEDPGAFNMPWNARQRFYRAAGDVKRGRLDENICAENNTNFLNYDVVPLPHSDKPEF